MGGAEDFLFFACGRFGFFFGSRFGLRFLLLGLGVLLGSFGVLFADFEAFLSDFGSLALELGQRAKQNLALVCRYHKESLVSADFLMSSGPVLFSQVTVNVMVS